MINKHTISKISISLALLFVFSMSVYAQGTKLIPMGRTTGMKFFTDGACVISLTNVDGQCPAKDAGLTIGDIILSANGKKINTNEELSKIVQNTQGELDLIILRDGEERALSVTPQVSNEGQSFIGAYVRDSMAGIGTITYVDPESGDYGALGHGVADMDTGILMHVERGSLMPSSVIGVNKGKSGEPGELQGSYDLAHSQGTIEKNDDRGIYGIITDDSMFDGMTAIETAQKDEIVKGKAQIISNVSGEETAAYDIEIIKIYDDKSGDFKDMMIKITDDDLIEKTGGIVQGMSGSPIIQNGKLIGAVTHVLINDPHRGYGISIEKMLQAAA